MQSEDSRSISLENEEEEFEEEEEEAEEDMEVYDEESSTRKRLLVRPDQNEGQPMEAYPLSGEGDYESDDPVPDDEDIDNRGMYKFRNQEEINKRKNIRSTSHNKHVHKNFNKAKNAFKNRKASNRPFVKEQLTSQNLHDFYPFSRNNANNLSHAHTHYSPASLKNQQILEGAHSTKAFQKLNKINRGRAPRGYGNRFKTKSRARNNHKSKSKCYRTLKLLLDN